MSKLTFLILSGPTREYIDPVRFITNESSGKMGKALFDVVVEKKHKLIFITGQATELPVLKDKNVEIINVTTAQEMFEAVKKNLAKADIVISAAAICDFRVAHKQKHKIKKTTDRLTLELVKNPDIIAYCASHKKNRVIVGFALETKDLIKNAKEKLKKKNLDFIVANTNKSFGQDKTSAYILRTDAKPKLMENLSKIQISRSIINESISIFTNTKTNQNHN
jgi:phosphopantothenoylcysteine synthetase/decarboxylase